MKKLIAPSGPHPPGRAASERFMNAITLRQLRYFIAVAETGRIGAAAEMVRISPSAITDAISELEALTDAKMFVRHARGLTLTFEGRRFLSHCRNIMSAVENASLAVSRRSIGQEGVVTVGVSITVSGYYLSTLLARFRQAFPNIDVVLLEDKRRRLEERILSQELDVALMLVSNLEHTDRIASYTLVHSLRRLWLPPRHKLLEQPSISLADVAAEPYVQLMIDDAKDSTEAYWKANQLCPRIVFETESMEAVRSFVASGHGVTILSDMMYKPWSLEGDRIEVRDISANIPTLNTGLAWLVARNASPAVKCFMEFCKEEADVALRRMMPVETV